MAAGVSFLVLLPVAILAARLSLGRPAIAAFSALLVVAVALTTLIGGSASREPSPSWVRASQRVLTERRVELWRDAWILARDHPLTGIGPGRFAHESPTALADADADRAHQGFLQMGAEAGFPAMALLVALFLWAQFRLGMMKSFGYPQAVAAAAVTALGLHACIDYVLHFAAVPVAAAAVLGAAVSVRRTGVRS
jgi:O-antigen ligase